MSNYKEYELFNHSKAIVNSYGKMHFPPNIETEDGYSLYANTPLLLLYILHMPDDFNKRNRILLAFVGKSQYLLIYLSYFFVIVVVGVFFCNLIFGKL